MRAPQGSPSGEKNLMSAKGFFNKILVIDLTAGAFKEEFIPDNITAAFLGGKGLGSLLLLRHNPPRVDPLSPQNCLIFTTGPGTDTPLLGSSRLGVYLNVAKNLMLFNS